MFYICYFTFQLCYLLTKKSTTLNHQLNHIKGYCLKSLKCIKSIFLIFKYWFFYTHILAWKLHNCQKINNFFMNEEPKKSEE